MEEWKTVEIDGVTYKDYEVSTKGRVRNVKTGRILKQRKDSGGYLQVSLHRKQFLVHRLVGFTFIYNDNPTEKTQINHIDEDRTNNCVENLEWVSPKQNLEHGTRTEKWKESRKESSKRVRCVETGEIFDSCNHVEKEKGYKHESISRCCRGLQKTAYGKHWEFVEEK